MDWRRHLVSDPAICHGKPTIRGTRVLVSVLLSHLAHGETSEEILADYPTVSTEALRAVHAFTAEPDAGLRRLRRAGRLGGVAVG